MDVPSLGTPSALWSAAAGHEPLVEPPSASGRPSNAPGLGIVAANDLSSQGGDVSRPPNDCAFVSGSTEGEVHVPSEAVKGGVIHSSATEPVQPAPLREVLDGWTQPLTGDLRRLHVTVTKEFLRFAGNVSIRSIRVESAARNETSRSTTSSRAHLEARRFPRTCGSSAPITTRSRPGCRWVTR